MLGVGLARDLDARAGTLELARLFRGRRHLLLGRLGPGNQGLGRFLGFGTRHLRQDERDRDESDQGQSGDDEQYGAHILSPQ